MASVLLVLLVAMLAFSATASSSSSSSYNQQQKESGSDEVARRSCAITEGELGPVRDKCCNNLGKCGKFICPTVKQVADSIPLLQGMCSNYNACSAGWNGKEDASSMLKCKANECKAAVEALKKEYMGCFGIN